MSRYIRPIMKRPGWNRLMPGPDPQAVGRLLEQMEALGQRNLLLCTENEALREENSRLRAEVAVQTVRAADAERAAEPDTAATGAGAW